MTSSLLAKAANRHQRDYSAVCWTEYFDEAHDIYETNKQATTTTSNQEPLETGSESESSFRVYLKNFCEPYAPARRPGQRLEGSQLELSEAELASYTKTPTLVALHGGGYSALTWAQFTKHIQRHCHCRLLAIDLRAHGDTKTSDDERMDIDTLVSDVISITHATHQQVCGFPVTPKIVLIGHSMGGAIVVKCADRCAEYLPSLAGFVVIDVVEGTAKDALPLMLSVIKTRPTKFPTLNNAIEWSVRSGMAKNADAARVSMPGNLVNIATGLLAIHDVDSTEQNSSEKSKLFEIVKKHKFSISLEQLIGPGPPAALLPRLPLPARVSALKGVSTVQMPPPPPPPPPPTVTTSGSVINEEQEEQEKAVTPSTLPPKCAHEQKKLDNEGYKKPAEIDNSGYCWRTDLAKTEPYWNGWFDGLSAQLLSSPVQGKFLLLAGIDRLDKTLTIGHMQGKFMMKVLTKCGHAVHEDVPEQVASAIGDFLVRNKFATQV